MEESAFSRNASATPPGRRGKALLFLLISFVILAVILFAGSKFLGNKKQDEQKVESAKVAPTAVIEPTETPTEEKEPSPIPKKSSVTPTKQPTPTTQKPTSDPLDKASGLDRSTLSIEVLNGSGVVGAAGKMSDTLKGFGYSISSTDNADNFDYQNVTIQVKSTKSKYLPLLQKDLSGSYSIGNTSSDLASGSADAVIIVGK